jgi:hypothetical protein
VRSIVRRSIMHCALAWVLKFSEGYLNMPILSLTKGQHPYGGLAEFES